jgi:Bacterial membrane protein YfhO
VIPTAPLAPRAAWAWVVALFTALTAMMFAPWLAGHGWFVWDVPDQYWPDLVYLCESLRHGEWPRWNPYDRFGYPFAADPQNGQFYPLNHALCALSRGAPSRSLAELRAPLHFVLAGCAMTGFLRARGAPWGAAVLGGVAFFSAPYPRRMWEVNLSYTLAWLPAVLWAVERLAQSPDARRAAILALVVAAATSVGSPPSLYFTALTAAVFTLARCLPHRRTWPWLLGAGALTLGMCAVMVLPTRDLSRDSVQRAKDFHAIAEGAYPLRDLPGLLWPRNKFLYLGAPLVSLATLGAARPSVILSRAIRLTLAATALVALAMMFGAHTPVFRVAFHLVPGVSAFREPVRYSAVLGACAAVLAAAGALHLPRPKLTLPLLTALIFATAFAALPPDRDLRPGDPPGAAARWNALRGRLPGDTSSWRAWDEFGLGLRAGTRFQFRDGRGYQDPLQSERYARVINGLDHSPALLAQYGVRYLLRGPHFLHGTTHHFLPAGAEPRIATSLGDGLWAVRDALPTAYWVPRAEALPSGDAVITRLRALAPSPVCLLESPDVSDPPGAQGVGMVPGHTLVARDAVTVTVNAPTAGWLVVNEAWAPGWRATVNGVETPVRRANFLMRAVRVGAGPHRVVMTYAPSRDLPLRGLALLSLLTCAWLVWRGGRAARAPRG